MTPPTESEPGNTGSAGDGKATAAEGPLNPPRLGLEVQAHVLRGDTAEELARAITHRLAGYADVTGGLRLPADVATNLRASIARFDQLGESGVDTDSGVATGLCSRLNSAVNGDPGGGPTQHVAGLGDRPAGTGGGVDQPARRDWTGDVGPPFCPAEAHDGQGLAHHR